MSVSRRVVLLTNFIPPYRVPLLRVLEQRLGGLYIVVSTTMEENRSWEVNTSGLSVIQQRTLSFRIRHRYRPGVSEKGYLHIPYDTMAWLCRLRPKVILTGEMGARTVQALLYRKLFDRKAFVIVHADVAESTERARGRTRSFIRRWIIKEADGIFVNGASGKRYIRSLGGLEAKIFAIPYTTEISSFADVRRSPPRTAPERLLYVGQLIGRKGLNPFAEVLLRWARHHPYRRVLWTLVGEGPLREELGRMQTPTNLRLSFTGFVPYEQLPQVYAMADLFVFPTFADTWGVVVNEALASGLPVLGSLYSQAVEELIQDGANGWTFHPDDRQGMYTALDRALSTPPDKLHEMQEVARRRGLALTPDAVAEKIIEAIAECERHRAKREERL